MFGPVSLSGNFPQYAKEIIVDFYQSYFRSEQKLVDPIYPFEYETSEIALNNPFQFNNYKEDLKLLKKLKGLNLFFLKSRYSFDLSPIPTRIKDFL